MTKNHLVLSLAFLALAWTVGCSDDDGGGMTGTRTVTGNGTIVSENRMVNGFTGVNHAGEGSVHVTLGAAEALRVETDQNLLQHIITEVQGGVLQIRTEGGVDIVPTQTVEYFLTVVDLETVALSGAGTVEVPPLAVNQLSLSLGGVGEIDCSGLDALELHTMLTGVGDVRCDGQVDSQVVAVTGVGTYDAPNLFSREAIVTVGSEGSAKVNVSERLTATVTGFGSVTYVDSSGGGLIVQCTPPSGCSPAP